MLSKNANIIFNLLKEDSQGFIPVNIYVEGLTRNEVMNSISELYNLNLIKKRDCQGDAIELNNDKMRIEELKKEIKEQGELNIKMFKSVPLASHADPSNKKAESILTEWRKGSKRIKSMIQELAELERIAKRTNEVKTNNKTFVNGFEEATKRNITCSTYERADKRMQKEILLFIGGR